MVSHSNTQLYRVAEAEPVVYSAQSAVLVKQLYLQFTIFGDYRAIVEWGGDRLR